MPRHVLVWTDYGTDLVRKRGHLSHGICVWLQITVSALNDRLAGQRISGTMYSFMCSQIAKPVFPQLMVLTLLRYQMYFAEFRYSIALSKDFEVSRDHKLF